jgi:hypothetical protein
MNGHPAEIRSVRADGLIEKSTDVLVSEETSFSRHSWFVSLSENGSKIFGACCVASSGMRQCSGLSRDLVEQTHKNQFIEAI